MLIKYGSDIFSYRSIDHFSLTKGQLEFTLVNGRQIRTAYDQSLVSTRKFEDIHELLLKPEIAPSLIDISPETHSLQRIDIETEYPLLISSV